MFGAHIGTVYDTASKEAVYQVAYTSTRGPAFIWSMAFSADSTHLALGCWSGNAHLYRLTRTADAAPTAAAAPSAAAGTTPDDADAAPAVAPLTVTETDVIARSDRVYAVAPDEDGTHLCIGGRDKMCAMYATAKARRGRGGGGTPRTRRPSQSTPLVWSAESDDFV